MGPIGYVLLGIAFLVLIIIAFNIKIVPQSRAYVIERLGAYSATWQTGLHFKERIAERKVVKAKRDCYAVELVVRRRLEILIYRFDVFSNGKVSLMVTSDNRDSMLFSGELAL